MVEETKNNGGQRRVNKNDFSVPNKMKASRNLQSTFEQNQMFDPKLIQNKESKQEKRNIISSSSSSSHISSVDTKLNHDDYNYQINSNNDDDDKNSGLLEHKKSSIQSGSGDQDILKLKGDGSRERSDMPLPVKSVTHDKIQ